LTSLSIYFDNSDITNLNELYYSEQCNFYLSLDHLSRIKLHTPVNGLESNYYIKYLTLAVSDFLQNLMVCVLVTQGSSPFHYKNIYKLYNETNEVIELLSNLTRENSINLMNFLSDRPLKNLGVGHLT
jgi:hypothetical protein